MTAVHEVMSTDPITVSPVTWVADLLSLFDRHDFNAFPVIRQGKRLVGIVSKLDVLRLVSHRSALLRVDEGIARVGDVMRRKVVSVDPKDRIADAGNLMVVTGLRSLPVVRREDAGLDLLGMLSRGDVLRGLRLQLADGTHAFKKAS
jgi:CBS domain-containing membrane protein